MISIALWTFQKKNSGFWSDFISTTGFVFSIFAVNKTAFEPRTLHIETYFIQG